MSRRSFSAVRLMLDTILLSSLAAPSKLRLAAQPANLRFRGILPNRSNMSQLRAVNTLLPPRRKEPWEDMRAPSSATLHKLREVLGYQPRGSHYLTIVNWSGGLTPERCWRAWASRFPLA